MEDQINGDKDQIFDNEHSNKILNESNYWRITFKCFQALINAVIIDYLISYNNVTYNLSIFADFIKYFFFKDKFKKNKKHNKKKNINMELAKIIEMIINRRNSQHIQNIYTNRILKIDPHKLHIHFVFHKEFIFNRIYKTCKEREKEKHQKGYYINPPDVLEKNDNSLMTCHICKKKDSRDTTGHLLYQCKDDRMILLKQNFDMKEIRLSPNQILSFSEKKIKKILRLKHNILSLRSLCRRQNSQSNDNIQNVPSDNCNTKTNSVYRHKNNNRNTRSSKSVMNQNSIEQKNDSTSVIQKKENNRLIKAETTFDMNQNSRKQKKKKKKKEYKPLESAIIFDNYIRDIRNGIIDIDIENNTKNYRLRKIKSKNTNKKKKIKKNKKSENQNFKKIKNFKNVKAHTNNDDIHSLGNAAADRLATQAIKKRYNKNNNKSSYNKATKKYDIRNKLLKVNHKLLKKTGRKPNKVKYDLTKNDNLLISNYNNNKRVFEIDLTDESKFPVSSSNNDHKTGRYDNDWWLRGNEIRTYMYSKYENYKLDRNNINQPDTCPDEVLKFTNNNHTLIVLTNIMAECFNQTNINNDINQCNNINLMNERLFNGMNWMNTEIIIRLLLNQDTYCLIPWIQDSHWIVINMYKVNNILHFKYYNSMEGFSSIYANISYKIFNWIRKLIDLLHIDNIYLGNFRYIECNWGRQGDSSSCGLWTIKFMELLINRFLNGSNRINDIECVNLPDEFEDDDIFSNFRCELRSLLNE